MSEVSVRTNRCRKSKKTPQEVKMEMRNRDYVKRFSECSEELLHRFGSARLEETGFPAYFSWFWPASWLMWRRVFAAQRLLVGLRGQSVLDFGSGLGVLLPYLEENFGNVVACDRDAEITEFMIRRLDLKHVQVVRSVSDCQGRAFDVVLALDILEHVGDLSETLRSLEDLTVKDGRWVISGPTENVLYRLGRKIARTTGEGHVRTIYDVLEEVCEHMTCERQFKLPPAAPFFLIALFTKGPR